MTQISKSFPARSSINNQTVWKMKITIKMAKELKKLYRKRDKMYRSIMGSTSVLYDIVAFIFVLGFVKGKQAF